jgi:hypothetical protein
MVQQVSLFLDEPIGENNPMRGASWTTANEARLHGIHVQANTPAHLREGSMGFVFLAPLMRLRVYEDEFYDAMGNFTARHPHDLLSPDMMILAAQIYFDIRRHPEMRLKEFACPENRTRGSQLNTDLPLVDLATFIIYFPHWLRHPENTGLRTRIHPY